MRFIRLFFVLTLALTAPAIAQDRPLKGVALVIGESDYGGALHPLANPKNDARAMDRLLGDLGFDVTRVLDGDGKKLQSEIADFAAAAKDADVALVYYSGHGIEAGGENYLVPVDADLSSPQKAGQTLIPLADLLDQLARSVPVTIMLLDACRSNAFPAGTMIQLPGAPAPVPAVESGLAEVRGPTPVAKIGVPPSSLGMVIGFAASPGRPALDGAPGEPNSPYAAALLKHLSAGGYSFGDVMTMVGEEVYLKTKAQQLPWVNSSLRRVLNFGTPVEDTDADERAIKDGRRQLLLSIASEPAATRGTVEAIATAQDVPLDALYGMLKVLGVDTSAGAADLEKQLEQGAKQLKAFKEQELGTAGSDPELKRLADLAGRAQGEGAIDLALKYREQATARARILSGERDALEAGLEADRLEIGRTFAEHAQTAALNFDYATAAQMFSEAFGQVAKWDDDLALTYKRQQAEALRNFGDFHADNNALQQSIAAFKEALLLAPRDKKPGEWVDINTNLGWALGTLGERLSDAAALNEAIVVLQAALDASPPGSSATDLALTRLNLGNAVSVLGQRDSDPQRLQQAVRIFEQAIADLPRSVDPYIWGKLQYNLGGALRVEGEREDGTDSMQRSIAAFEAAIEVITRQLSPLEWAKAQNGYATALISLAEHTHETALLNKAAAALNLSLEENTESRVPLDWAIAQSNLGNVYVRLSEETGDVESIRKGIEAFKASLRQLRPDNAALFFATAQSNLGVALTSLSEKTHDRSLLSDAANAFEAALEVRTEQNDPPGWATTEFNLSTTLAELGADEASPLHLQQAIVAANAALRQWTRQDQPVFWAKAHHALGIAYTSLGDKETTSDSYKAGAEAFAEALQVFDKDSHPVEWLMTTKKYAFALENVGERDGSADYLNKAVAAYRDVLSVTTVAADPEEFGRLNFNLGLCLLNLDAYGGLADGYRQAATQFRVALTGYTRDLYPQDWADTQYRLGYTLHSAVSKMPSGGADELNEAIAAYQAGQQVRTRDADPFGWAELENYVGMAYGLLGSRTSDKAALQAGRDDIAAAWEVYKSRDASYDEDFKTRLAQFDDALAGMS